MLFLLLAIGGVSLTGAAPTPPKNRSIINTETAIKKEDEEDEESPADEAFYSWKTRQLVLRAAFFKSIDS